MQKPVQRAPVAALLLALLLAQACGGQEGQVQQASGAQQQKHQPPLFTATFPHGAGAIPCRKLLWPNAACCYHLNLGDSLVYVLRTYLNQRNLFNVSIQMVISIKQQASRHE